MFVYVVILIDEAITEVAYAGIFVDEAEYHVEKLREKFGEDAFIVFEEWKDGERTWCNNP